MTARDVYEKLRAKGRAVTLRVTTASGGDPATGDPGTPTVADYTVYVVEGETTYAQRLANARQLGIDVAMKDRCYMMAAYGLLAGAVVVLPSVDSSMKIIDGGAELSIVAPGPVKPADEVLYYAVAARGA